MGHMKCVMDVHGSRELEPDCHRVDDLRDLGVNFRDSNLQWEVFSRQLDPLAWMLRVSKGLLSICRLLGPGDAAKQHLAGAFPHPVTVADESLSHGGHWTPFRYLGTMGAGIYRHTVRVRD